ncbi:ribonuclease HI family protein [Enterococcus sp. RIT-PI-f]|uniref:ribonuclease HI family protein n=1 Tax=Enterococcus sp. RIT-PI-f TaxID=1690244 RepID=UPI0006B8D525|nr:ribonuclease HI family protein [Enterococcus sp. RIT-PI-f]KPG71673.1 ribonuclease HI [Enterococcus sp. RIT-PI-f]
MLKIYLDASTKGNPGPSGGGIMLVGDQIYEQLSFPLAQGSNHQAEFAVMAQALTFVLERKLHQQTCMFFTDSKIVAQTIDKDYTNNPDFKDYLQQIHLLLDQYALAIIQWIPESQNKGADHLARQGLAKALKLQDR